ncbi:MAG: FAD-dependent thymidylate synthase [Nitrospirae bacterium]|nr:FAD-dependent thymidylate synthase [Nitrospirota bacterium]
MKVTLVNSFARPFDNAVAAARTCYAPNGIVTPEQVAGQHLTDPDKRQRANERKHKLAAAIYQAGHHTTLQHVHLQFALEGVSRQFIWSFLHAHPFYNSEQVSQRYVTVTPDQVYLPEGLAPAQRDIYLAAVARQMADYARLTEALLPLARAEYARLFRGRADQPRGTGDIQKKAQEVARYLLPVGTTAYLYHTVSLLTLLRYRRLTDHFDTPAEQRRVIGAMVAQVLAQDPDLKVLMEDPLPIEATPEFALMARLAEGRGAAGALIAGFDRELDGRTSRLIDWSGRGEQTLARAVREVLGVTPRELDDDAAIAAVLDPAQNPYMGETLNLKLHTKLGRAMVHPHYTFAKKLSHTADSQDQRHRLTPASRPILSAHVGDAPDYVTPLLVRQDGRLEREFARSMEQTWDDVARLKAAGAPEEAAHYLLPNALAIRFTESADLAALHHKMAMRLCYNAQEEIWQASRDEAEQVRAVHPRIGRWLLPPCGLRDRAGTRPVCPEGDRYCGVKVWRLDLADYHRVI